MKNGEPITPETIAFSEKNNETVQPNSGLEKLVKNVGLGVGVFIGAIGLAKGQSNLNSGNDFLLSASGNTKFSNPVTKIVEGPGSLVDVKLSKGFDGGNGNAFLQLNLSNPSSLLRVGGEYGASLSEKNNLDLGASYYHNGIDDSDALDFNAGISFGNGTETDFVISLGGMFLFRDQITNTYYLKGDFNTLLDISKNLKGFAGADATLAFNEFGKTATFGPIQTVGTGINTTLGIGNDKVEFFAKGGLGFPSLAESPVLNAGAGIKINISNVIAAQSGQTGRSYYKKTEDEIEAEKQKAEKDKQKALEKRKEKLKKDIERRKKRNGEETFWTKISKFFRRG